MKWQAGIFIYDILEIGDKTFLSNIYNSGCPQEWQHWKKTLVG
jgi:hypothetical protein